MWGDLGRKEIGSFTCPAQFASFLLTILLTILWTVPMGSASPLDLLTALPLDFVKFDEFGDLSCKDEIARLDNFAYQLKRDSEAQGAVIVYGGKNGYVNEAEARGQRIKEYLLNEQKLDPRWVKVENGGFRNELTVELWVLPRLAGDLHLAPSNLVSKDEVRLKRGRVGKQAYKMCQAH
jgi:hypothetical protein